MTTTKSTFRMEEIEELMIAGEYSGGILDLAAEDEGEEVNQTAPAITQQQEPRPAIEVVDIDDDVDLDSSRPLPSDLLLQRKEAEWTFLHSFDEEPLEEDEEPLSHRRQRRQHRSLITEPIEETSQQVLSNPPSPFSETAPMRHLPSDMEETHIRRERKRKGKEMATPLKKKSRPTNRAVIIQEPVHDP